MVSSVKNNIRICLALLARDSRVIFGRLVDNIIDSSIIVFFVYFVFARLLPSMGLNPVVILPSFLGTIVLVLANVSFDRAMLDALDFEFTRFIQYQATLPLSGHWLVIIYLASYCSSKAVSLGCRKYLVSHSIAYDIVRMHLLPMACSV